MSIDGTSGKSPTKVVLAISDYGLNENTGQKPLVKADFKKTKKN